MRSPCASRSVAGLYARYFGQLEQAQLVYPCFCTPLELELSRRASCSQAGHRATPAPAGN